MTSANGIPRNQRFTTAPEHDADATFQHSAELAAHLFDVPVAIVALTRPEQHRVLATVGLEEGPDADQARAFCTYTARAGSLTVVENLGAVPQFAGHPLVSGPPELRSYAGAPLTDTNGVLFGALVVLGTTPSVPTGEDLRQLRRLAAIASNGLAMRPTTDQESEKDLRGRQPRYQTLVQRFPEGGVFVFDNELECTLAGGTELADVGPTLGKGEANRSGGRSFSENEAEHEAHFRAALEGEHRVYERAYQGERYRIDAAPVRDTDGRIVAGMAVSQNITDRCKDQEGLRQSKDRLHRAQRIAQLGYWELDLDTGSISWSAETRRIFGWDPDIEVTYEKFMEVVHPEDRESLKAAQTAVVKGEKERIDVEYRIRHPSGERRVVHEQGARRYAEDGSPVAVTGAVRDITERWTAEQALREREAQLRGLANSIPGVVIQFDMEPDGEIGFHFVGTHAEELLGLSADPEDFFGRMMEHLPAPHDERFLKAMNEAVDARASFRFEAPFVKPSGERIWLLGTATPRKRGDELLYNGVLLDITERKEAEQALRKSETRFRTLFEKHSAPMLLIEPESGYIVEANASAVDFYGYDAETLTSMRIQEINQLSPEEVEARRAAAETQSQSWFVFPHCLKSGDLRTVEVHSTPVKIQDQSLLFSIVHDITEQREAERKLEKSEQRYRTLAEHFPNGAVGVYDYNLRYTLAAGALLGEALPSSSELEGSRIPDIFPNETVADLKPLFRAAVEEGATGSTEITFDGRDWKVWATPLRDAEGEVFAGLSLAQDITERKRREQELRGAKEEAEEASRLKSAMLANMSHEIRTPLTAITGFSEVLKKNLHGEMATFADKVYSSSQRLMKTLDSVLQLSKLEAGTYSPKRERVQLRAVVKETVDMLRSTAEEDSVELAMRLPEAPVEGRWSEGALNRIVGNLLENAIKFTPSGGRVTVRVRTASDAACLEVEDTGVGISDEFMTDIFEAFRQESTGVDREYEGSGLGLSIVQRLVEALDGTIAVESEKGEGTCFTVRLPMTDEIGKE